MLSRSSRRVILSLALALPSFGLVSCNDNDGVDEPVEPTIVENAAAAPQLSTLVSALTAAGLTSTLSGAGPFTVFAPVNSAFEALPADVLQRLL